MAFDAVGRITELRHFQAPAAPSGFDAGSSFGMMTETASSPPPPTSADHATSDNPPTISWPASEGATSYEIYLINLDDNSSQSVTGITGTSWTPSAPLQETKYRVFVRAANDAGVSAWGTAFDFIVGNATAPGVPQNLSVIHSDTPRPTLLWDPEPGASSYTVYFVNVDTGAVVAQVTQADTSYTQPTDLPDGTYGFYVRAHNGVGSSSWAPRYDFVLAAGSPPLAAYYWQYDAANRPTLQVSTADGKTTYTYDDTDQLTGADRSGTSSDESYAYDSNGNRTGDGYATSDDNRLSSDGTYNYTYDDEGNRLTKTNIATGEVIEYDWDHRNRLTGITTKDSLGAVTHQVAYTYDIFNRRIVKTIDTDGAGAGTATKEIYIHDGLRADRGGAGDHILLTFDGSGDLTGRYLHGPAVDQILAGEEVTSTSAAGDVLWPLTDHLGTVRDLAEYDAVTDTTTVANHITYDAFGNVTAETDAAVDFLFGYTGRERDAESDLQYNRARYYDATIGRWISQDPIGFQAGDANLYRYVENGPTTKADPSGRVEKSGWLDIYGSTEMNGYVVPSNALGYTLSIPGAFFFWPLFGGGKPATPTPGSGMSAFAGSQLRQNSHYMIVQQGGNFEGRICPSQPVPPSDQMTIRLMAEGYFTFLSSGGDMVLAVTPIVIVPRWPIYSASDEALAFGCEEVADQILAVLGNGQKYTIKPVRGNVLPKPKGPADSSFSPFNWFTHTVVVHDGMVYDAMTGFQGLPIDDYKQLWQYPQDIVWPF